MFVPLFTDMLTPIFIHMFQHILHPCLYSLLYPYLQTITIYNKSRDESVQLEIVLLKFALDNNFLNPKHLFGGGRGGGDVFF
jgi:hypothetical protein